MIDNITSAGMGALYPTRPTSRTSAAVPTAEAQGDTTIPGSPPPEVLHALDTAQQVMADLKSRNLEIRFDVSEGKVRAQMVDDEGTVVREFPARHGLDMLSGNHTVDYKA